jgi:transcriptional regulator GlxA family with amidase domain
MNANLEEPLPLEELARIEGISIRQLQRLFRKYTTSTPAQYYLGQRLLKARQLLENTNLSVSEVAVAAGFATPAHFSQRYRAKFRCSPSWSRRTFVDQANDTPRSWSRSRHLELSDGMPSVSTPA